MCLSLTCCLVIGIELLSESLLPAIVELAEDKAWRVRQAIIEYIPLLATQLGKPFFDEQLGNLCMSWLGDSVYSIREAATVNLKKLTEVFGVDWGRTAIVPKVMGMANHPNYLYRLTTVQAITVSRLLLRSRLYLITTALQTIAPSLTPEIILADVIEPLLQLAVDPIPNIRFNVGKALEVIGAGFGPEGRDLAQQKIIPMLEQQKSDTDADVRYFAARALQHIATVIQGWLFLSYIRRLTNLLAG
jgi:serine/threonine-protein phosphatase 2A regulatory subunit A